MCDAGSRRPDGTDDRSGGHAFGLAEAGLAFKRQVALPIFYGDRLLDGGFRADILVADELMIETKSIEAISRVHEAQLPTCLRLTRRRIGLLMNFNVLRLKDGLRHFVMWTGPPQWRSVAPRALRVNSSFLHREKNISVST